MGKSDEKGKNEYDMKAGIKQFIKMVLTWCWGGNNLLSIMLKNVINGVIRCILIVRHDLGIATLLSEEGKITCLLTKDAT